MANNNPASLPQKSSPDKLGLLRIIKLLAFSLPITFSLLVIALFGLLATETGSRWLIQTLDSQIEQINITEINGTLLNELSLKQLHYQQTDHFSIALAQVKLHWHATELLTGHLHIAALQFEGVDIKGQPAGEDETESSQNIPSIPFSINIDELLVKQLNWQDGNSKTQIQQLSLAAKLLQNKLTVSKLKFVMPQIQLSGSSEVQIQSNWPITADLDWSYQLQKNAIHGKLGIDGTLQKLNLQSVISGLIESKQSGFIKLSNDQPEFNLTASWQKLQWPLTGMAQFSSQRGNILLQGNINDYQSQLNADIVATTASNTETAFKLDFNGHGNQHSLAIAQLRLKPTIGSVDLNGHLTWLQPLTFNLNIVAKQLNPATFGSDIAASLNLKALTQGTIDGEKINAELDIKHITGKLYDQPLNAHGKVKFTDKQLSIQTLKVTAGKNQLTASGQVNEQNADLQLLISATDLSTAWPTLTGSVNGNAQIKGSLQTAKITADLQARNIRYQDQHLAGLSLNANYLHGSSKQSTLQLNAQDIQFSDHHIKQINLKGHGNQNHHQMNLTLQSSFADLNINSDGYWKNQQYRGQIKQLTIEHAELKKWQLQSPTSFVVKQNKNNHIITLSDSCLIQNDARLCFSAESSAEKQLNARVSLSSWPLSLTKHWLPEEMALSGTLSAQAQLSSTPHDMSAQINGKISDGLARFENAENEAHELAFSTSSLQLQYEQDQLQSQIQLNFAEKDFINARINANKANQAGIRQLSGIVQSNITDMTLIDSLIPEINQLQGLFIANMIISGDSSQPTITGSAQWQNGQFEIPLAGSQFRNIQLEIQSTQDNPDRLLINTTIESGPGKIIGKGHLDLLSEQHFPMQLAVTGKNFQVSRLPEAEVIISPDIKIIKQDSLTQIDGLIKIDKSKIEIKTLPESAIAPSKDEEIITTNQVKKKKLDPKHLNAHLSIQFGEKTQFSGFGLKTDLTGQLEYIIEPNRQRMQGRAIMKNASYHSYGQDLTIRKGEFLFNGPADNPWLNIEAIRKAKTEDITAVLNLTGQLKSPETRIFTEPALAESEALAYLITGNSLNRISKSDGNAVAGAAFNYGVGQLSWLSDQLGIDEFEFEQGDTIENSAVRLGQYLNPDLYVGITMGLFADKYAANLRYSLNKNFSIRTRAGETQRIDLKYHFESD